MELANLLVEPERLRNQSTQIEQDIESMKQNVQSMESAFSEMRRYWKGGASDYQYRLFEGLLDDLNKTYLLLKEYPSDILKLAGLYEETEEENKAIAGATSTSITMGNY